jgi:hypothetical protein
MVPVVCFAAVALYAWFGGEHTPTDPAAEGATSVRA